MSSITLGLSSELLCYLQQHSVKECEAQIALRLHTLKLPGARMQISPEQGQLLAWLIRLTNAKTILEIGTYTGYSALCMALALPKEGKLITCDVDANTTEIAIPYWREAGVFDKIERRIGPALETLAALTKENIGFDFAFIDADKNNYLAYYEAILPLLNPNGIIAIDNVFWGGDVVNTNSEDKRTIALRELNDFVYQDSRVDVCMLPIGDGLTLVRKL